MFRKTSWAYLALFTLALPLHARAERVEYGFDPAHSHVAFKVRHMMITNVRGEFTKFDGKLLIDESNLENSSIEVEIDAASIDTNNQKRDDHLRGADFFEVEKYPKLLFKSKSIKKKGKDKLEIVGDLTIRGVTKPVTLEAEGFTTALIDPWGNRRRGGTATATINRKDFGLTWNKVLEKGGILVGEEVKIELDIELVQKKSDKKTSGR